MNCIICQNLLSEDRVNGLRLLGKLENEFICYNCSIQYTHPIKMIFSGTHNVSGQIFVDSLSQKSGIEREPENDLEVDNDEDKG